MNFKSFRINDIKPDTSELKRYIPSENLLFVDDGSSDRTAEVLKASDVPYLSHPVNLGYKEAMRTAIHYGLPRAFHYFVFFDADGQHRTVDLLSLIRTFEKGGADFIIGSRFRGSSSAWDLRRLVNRSFSFLTSLFSGARISDVTCGLKLISRDFVQPVLDLPSEDFHAELIVGLAWNGARIKEVGIEVEPRSSGTSMYHFWKALLYPAKTLLCLIAGIPIPHNSRGGRSRAIAKKADRLGY